jgi:hypothetical protein
VSEWVCIVRLDSDDDPGAELMKVLKARFGEGTKTSTALAFLYDDAREERKLGPLRGRPGFVAEHEHRGLKRRYGK